MGSHISDFGRDPVGPLEFEHDGRSLQLGILRQADR